MSEAQFNQTQQDRQVPRPVATVDIREKASFQASGFVGLAVALFLGLIGLIAAGMSGNDDGTGGNAAAGLLAFVFFVGAVLVLTSLTVVQPGETRVVQFLGQYVGTARKSGWVWLLPLTTRKRVSIRVNNFETARLKVNDSDGNPVELAAIVVWQVADTARAMFAVESYHEFVSVQADAALRHVARSYPYDAPDGAESLRGSTDVISAELAREVAARASVAGVQILEVRISHLAYAPEIAQAMLQRQQASAVVAARARIVEGAVGMVQMALDQLSSQGVVELDQERRAAMVSNLLVVLCGDSRATPVVNTGVK